MHSVRASSLRAITEQCLSLTIAVDDYTKLARPKYYYKKSVIKKHEKLLYNESMTYVGLLNTLRYKKQLIHSSEGTIYRIVSNIAI